MTDEQINAAIAEACGWTDILDHPEFGLMGIEPDTHGCRTAIAWYTYDLNAMHDAEKTLKRMGPEYARTLLDIVSRNAGVGVQYAHGSFAHIKATARQRAEAFLRTLGKWEEAK